MEKILTEKSVLSENGQTFYWTSQANKEVTIVFFGLSEMFMKKEDLLKEPIGQLVESGRLKYEE